MMKPNKIVVLFVALISVLLLNAQSKKDLKKNKVKSYHQSHTSVDNGKETTLDAFFQKFDGNENVIEENCSAGFTFTE